MKNILKIIFIFVLLISAHQLSYAYSVDGDVWLDWGIDLNAAVNAGYLDTNLPTGGNDIDTETEDNADINTTGWFKVGPGYTVDGNDFDAEAMYFDNDADYAYIALIQGMSASGARGFLPGDIGIDVDGDSIYDFGLATINHDGFVAGSLYDVGSWNPVAYPAHAAESGPWNILSGSLITSGLTQFAYTSSAINGHYVMEMRISLADLGLDPAAFSNLTINWTQQCGNDYLNLNADVNPVVPEPASMLLLGSGLLGLAGIGFKKKKSHG